MMTAIQNAKLDMHNLEDRDRLLLSVKPSQRTMRYSQITAFGNHFRVDDASIAHLRSYNSGMATIFDLPLEHGRDLSVNYIGVLKAILLLSYDTLNIQIILMYCE